WSPGPGPGLAGGGNRARQEAQADRPVGNRQPDHLGVTQPAEPDGGEPLEEPFQGGRVDPRPVEYPLYQADHPAEKAVRDDPCPRVAQGQDHGDRGQGEYGGTEGDDGGRQPGAPPANAPTTRTSERADDDAMAETPSAHPVSAGSRPRRRNCW